MRREARPARTGRTRRRLLAPVVALLLAAPLAPAHAAPDRAAEGPSADDVARAERSVSDTQDQVAQLETALAAASASLESATIAAAQAAEAYNGARWELEQAQDEVERSEREQRTAAADVERLRLGLVTLVTESYQNGTQLDAATALLTDAGPTGLMERQAVVHSAGESMDARFVEFQDAEERAETATEQAEVAAERQAGLAADAELLATQAAGSAAAAAGAAASVATERDRLLTRLARVQQISLAVATRRQEALEAAAREEASATTAQETSVRDAASEESATPARETAPRTTGAAPQPSPAPRPRPARRPQPAPAPAPAPAPLPAPAPAPAPGPAPTGTSVQRAVAYAYAQVGKPYIWAAAGPDAFDCSGLTMQAWARGGRALPHYSVAQHAAGTPIPVSQARAGDLLFWSRTGSPSGIFHVALSLGGGRYIEAPRTGLNVRVSSFSYWHPTHAVRL